MQKSQGRCKLGGQCEGGRVSKGMGESHRRGSQAADKGELEDFVGPVRISAFTLR